MTTKAGASAYMVLHDPQATHWRRVRAMVYVSSAFLVVAGLMYSVYFAMRVDWWVVPAELALVAIGCGGILLARSGRLRLAAYAIFGSMYLLLLAMALLMDLPSPGLPRSVHHFYIPLAVAAYLFAKSEPTWIRYGFPLLGFATLVAMNVPELAVQSRFAIPDDIRSSGAWGNNFFAMAVLYVLVHIFIGDIGRMERYLQNANNRFVSMVGGMFPKAVAERLLASGESFAQRHSDCSVLFADIVGFTAIAEKMQPAELVAQLAEIFRRFDLCVEAAGLTKIKTIGDAYMVAAGVPDARPDHAAQAVGLARQMMAAVADMSGIRLRIGIASGELVAGVIGRSRQVFDVWGDVVNMASRLESHGLPGRIQVSEATFALTCDLFSYEHRADLAIKGKSGVHSAYLLGGA